MAKKKTGTAVYTVLINCQNDKTGRQYAPGDTVVAGKDFPSRVLKQWEGALPPVVEVANG